MSSILSSLNLSPFALVGIGLAVLAAAIVLLVAWVVAIDRRTRGVVDGLEVERRKVAEMQVIVSQGVARGGGPRPQGRPASVRGAGGASGAARGQNPGAARVGVPQNAEMGSQRVRAAQPASPAQARPAAAAASAVAPTSEEDQAFAAWVQERAQAMGQKGRSRGLRGRGAAGEPGVPGAAGEPGAAQGGRSRGGRPAREAHDPHAISVPRGVDKTGGVPMEQWTGPVGRPRDGRRGQVARQATAAAQAQAARVPGAQAQAQVASSRGRVEEAARAQRSAAQAQQRRSAQAARGAQGDPRATARAGARGGADAGARVDAGGHARGSAQAAAARQDSSQGRIAADSRPWQNPRANARQAAQGRAGRGGNPGNSGYVQVDAPATRQPRSYAQGASSPLQPRDSRRPMTQPHPERQVDDAPIPVQVEAASSTGLFHRKKGAEPTRGKHAR